MASELERRQFLALVVAGSIGGAAGCDTRDDGERAELAGGVLEGPMATNLTEDARFIRVADRTERRNHEPVGPTMYWVEDPGEVDVYLGDA